MAKDFTVDTSELKQAIDRLSYLKNFEKDQVLKDALKSSANKFVYEGRKAINVTFKNPAKLAKSLKTKQKLTRNGKQVALAGFDKEGRHAHILDYGTHGRKFNGTDKLKRTYKNATRGDVKEYNFWRSTFEANKESARKNLFNAIEKSANKLLLRN